MTETEKMLTDKGLPLPPYTPINELHYTFSGEWWAKTVKGWYWMRTCDVMAPKWVQAPQGPPWESRG